jgi:hypothetical protein
MELARQQRQMIERGELNAGQVAHQQVVREAMDVESREVA